jgi:hypothetical protein
MAERCFWFDCIEDEIKNQLNFSHPCSIDRFDFSCEKNDIGEAVMADVVVNERANIVADILAGVVAEGVADVVADFRADVGADVVATVSERSIGELHNYLSISIQIIGEIVLFISPCQPIQPHGEPPFRFPAISTLIQM